jgi:hypothetical protein
VPTLDVEEAPRTACKRWRVQTIVAEVPVGAPLLPAPPRPPYGGWHRIISDGACFAAIVAR